MKKIFSFKKLAAGVAVSAIVAAMVVTGTAMAAPGDPGGPGGPGGPGKGGQHASPEALLERARKALERQGERLDKADEIITRAGAWIEKQKSGGEDVSSLEAGLSAFKAAIKDARTYHDEASSLLNNPAGFDGNGKVTDETTARQTLRKVRIALMGAHLTLEKGAIEFRFTVYEWRKAHTPDQVEAPAG